MRAGGVSRMINPRGPMWDEAKAPHIKRNLPKALCMRTSFGILAWNMFEWNKSQITGCVGESERGRDRWTGRRMGGYAAETKIWKGREMNATKSFFTISIFMAAHFFRLISLPTTLTRSGWVSVNLKQSTDYIPGGCDSRSPRRLLSSPSRGRNKNSELLSLNAITLAPVLAKRVTKFR